VRAVELEEVGTNTNNREIFLCQDISTTTPEFADGFGGMPTYLWIRKYRKQTIDTKVDP
jgi:hypothetical protein